jgi:hypothetical protein
VKRLGVRLLLAPLAAAVALTNGGCTTHHPSTHASLPQPVTRLHGRCAGGGRLGTQGSLGGVPIPEQPEIFRITSIWHASRHGVDIDVHAGSLVDRPEQGILNVTWTNPNVGLPGPRSGTYLAPRPTGPLVLACVNDNTVSFAFRGGRGTFNLSTRRFVLSDTET